MPYRVLIVEDSHFFQINLKKMINSCPDLDVVGIAANGQEAIDMTVKLKPDIVSMDYEMPFMDGVSAVRIIMEKSPTPIVMFSSMTYEGARITLDALDAGAVDFMNKNFAEVSANSSAFKRKFHEKLITFASNANTSAVSSALGFAKESPPRNSASTQSALKKIPTATASAPRKASASLRGKVKLLAIGASTGGPVAVSDIVSALPASFPVPILIVQHMPENFTKAFAERLDRTSSLRVKEAQNGDRIERGAVLVAPGGQQMMIERGGQSVKIIAGDDRVNYKPCVDITFASAASQCSDGVLGLILTGMGSDGANGARLLKEKGSTIWSQDEQSCVVYGMPAAVNKENISTCVLPLRDIAAKLISEL